MGRFSGERQGSSGPIGVSRIPFKVLKIVEKVPHEVLEDLVVNVKILEVLKEVSRAHFEVIRVEEMLLRVSGE